MGALGDGHDAGLEGAFSEGKATAVACTVHRRSWTTEDAETRVSVRPPGSRRDKLDRDTPRPGHEGAGQRRLIPRARRPHPGLRGDSAEARS